uniref:Putative BRCA1-associated RING domain protein 1 n=1 Tax=Davidia involucrata TaxID=16924 RepID=A0A5B7AMK6_DAVIN
MADSQSHARFLNPWVLHLQKLGLELKCPLCLNLLNRPMLLPCNHIFCNFCIPTSTQFGSECPVCKEQYADRDIRPVPHMENIVTIYRSLDATFSTTLVQPVSSDAGKVPERHPVSVNTNVNDKLSKESVETPQEGNSSNGQSIFPLAANKRVQASPNHSVEDEIKFTVKFGKSTLPITGQMKEFEVHGGERVLHDECKSIPPQSHVWVRAVKHEKFGTEEINMNQVAQSSPGSPPSFGETRSVDDDNSDPPCSDGNKEKLLAKRLVDNNPDSSGCEMNDKPSLGPKDDHARDIKRQKKLNYGLLDMGVKSDCHAQSIGLHSENAATCDFTLEHKFGEPLSGAQKAVTTDSSDANKSVCAFCQSSMITDRTGAMMHYINGKEAVGDAATHPNVIHVHKKCIEWTPQAYYVGETVKNLEAEVARAAKLKCSSCGIKGAALGCFVHSCRKSYHVPCALDLYCRWDCEDFLVLCPIHYSAKFPSEKSKRSKEANFPSEKSKSRKDAKKKEHTVLTQITLKQSNFWAASPCGAKEWLLCGSALSAEEKYLLVKFASICGATVSKFWDPNVTHVIAATDAEGACSRTLKVLMAILNGKWILRIDWIKACMEAMHPMDELPCEVSLDNHGCCDGPKTGRLRALNNAPKLFNGLKFYFCGDFLRAYKKDLLHLVATAGGAVIENKEQLVARSDEVHATPTTTLVVYNVDPPQGCQFGEDAFALQRKEVAEDLAEEIGSQVIGHTWLLESIAACKLQPFAR